MRFILWLFDADQDSIGDPPHDGQEVEVVISDFRFLPFPSGIAEPETSPSFITLDLAPNPVTDGVSCSVKLERSAVALLRVYDTGGRVIEELERDTIGRHPSLRVGNGPRRVFWDLSCASRDAWCE
jgi:hypothetical protein